jgi:hypothetical protein
LKGNIKAIFTITLRDIRSTADMINIRGTRNTSNIKSLKGLRKTKILNQVKSLRKEYNRIKKGFIRI